MTASGLYRIQAALGLVYVCAGAAKLAGADVMVEAFDVTGLGQSLRIAVGVLEIGGGLCLCIPRASIYAAVVLGCTIVGILGAAVGHMARLGLEPLERPQLTVAKPYQANLKDDAVLRRCDSRLPRSRGGYCALKVEETPA
ncbi:MAG TPA: DoxX family protein [Xanthobacteraceae bacterium]|nr:DoxX family protein [Xanthobacteraceae bacterium]